MHEYKRIYRFSWLEIRKFWQRPIARLVLLLMIFGPIVGEVLLAQLSPRDAVYPRVTALWFSADMLMFISLATVVLSVLSLGIDFDLGTIPIILSRGVKRGELILSKVIATVFSSLVFGLAFIGITLISTIIAHIRISDIPLSEATGSDLLWRALGAGCVIGLVNFVLSTIVMLALILGRSSWLGMLAGIGTFFLDFFVGGLGTGTILGMEGAFRYTITFHAISIMEKLFPSDPAISLPRAWAEQGLANPLQAAMILIIYGLAIIILSIFIFRRQDLKVKN